MDSKPLPAGPSPTQYKKQAKELMKKSREGAGASGERFREDGAAKAARGSGGAGGENAIHDLGSGRKVALADAQLVIARGSGFAIWAKFAQEVERRAAENFAMELDDPVAEFLMAGCVPRDGAWHGSGTLERAEAILRAHPKVAKANVYTAAVLGDARGVKRWLQREAGNATAKGGPYGWDALTYLCFSRYLRLRQRQKNENQTVAQYGAPARRGRRATDGFLEAARALLDAGASANTGWQETNPPYPSWEAVMYGAAGIAQHPELTQLLLERGADPNDDETAYHVSETYDNTVMKILVESGKLNAAGVTTILLRKADWHDFEGMKWLLEHGADPNRGTRWGRTAFHHAVLRDNRIAMLELLLQHGADPMVVAEQPDPRPDVIGPPMTVAGIAVRRGRGDLLELMDRRRVRFALQGVERLLGACARGDAAEVRKIRKNEPELVNELVAQGGKVLAGFASVGNAEGAGLLLDLGVSVNEVFEEGDPYFDVTKESMALHVAAWRGWPETVKLLLERGAAVSIRDRKGRTPLMLAVKACVDSPWAERRTPDSVKALLEAGASTEGIEWPCGYAEVDELLKKFGGKSS
jgi:ankyrin repeat protein